MGFVAGGSSNTKISIQRSIILQVHAYRTVGPQRARSSLDSSPVSISICSLLLRK